MGNRAHMRYKTKSRFNRAAPFRERLSVKRYLSMMQGIVALQSCRPLSGAVMTASVLPAPDIGRFNRAAPFRERLFPRQVTKRALTSGLQSCRPLSGAVIMESLDDLAEDELASIVPPPFGSGYSGATTDGVARARWLQSCRPLSGAVIR